LVVFVSGLCAFVPLSIAQKGPMPSPPTRVEGSLFFDPVKQSVKIRFSNGKTFVFKAANNTTNPDGDSCEIGSCAPVPPGNWCLNPPCKADPDSPRYKRVGPAFFRIGSAGTIPYLRDVGLHAGSDSFTQLTFGCIRITNSDMTKLLNYLDATGYPLNKLSLPGSVKCSQTESGDQAATSPPGCENLLEEAMVKQAAAAGIDYFKVQSQSEAGNEGPLASMFKVTPYMDGEAAKVHGISLYNLLKHFGDREYSSVLGVQKEKVRDQVMQSLDYAFSTEAGATNSQSWDNAFPLTYRLGKHVPIPENQGASLEEVNLRNLTRCQN
jgi:hypothetical protein